jgi:hypothetical protein
MVTARLYISRRAEKIHSFIHSFIEKPCGGRVEYLHRDPASRRRRRKGKSQIWDSKRRSRDPRDSDPRKTALARASSIYKRQTRPVVREGAPQKQDRNYQRVRHQDLLTDWPSVAMWLRSRSDLSSFISRSEWFVNQNQVNHSRRKARREDSRSSERVLGSELLCNWLWLGDIVKEMSINPIIQSRNVIISRRTTDTWQ